MTNQRLLRLFQSIAVLLCAMLTSASFAAASEKLTLSGTIAPVTNVSVCGACSPSYSVVDTSGTVNLLIGNSFVDLSLISGDEQVHQFTGFFYQATGQCGINECTLFTVEELDTQQASAPTYNSSTERLSIQFVVIDNDNDDPYSVILTPPFNVDSSTLRSSQVQIQQGGDCSTQGAVCSSGTVCLAYFGIAGSQGPEFKSCEIPCSLPGASCPLGQSCSTIADGPGQVCRVD